MIYIIYIFKIILYFLFCRITYILSLKSYKKNKTRLTKGAVVFCSLMFGIYSLLVTNPNISKSLDRQNYYERYASGFDLTIDSPGLGALFEVLRPISLNANFLWFITGFLFVIIVLFAYRNFKDARPYALLFLICSSYIPFGYGGMKQTFANSLASLSLVLYFNRSYIKSASPKIALTLLIAAFAILSILFHEAAYLLVIVYLALAVWKYPLLRKIGWVVMFLSVIVFPILLNILFADIGLISESLEEQTMGYDSDEMGEVGNMLTVIKGVPFYIVCFIGFVERKKLLSRINEYDKYLLLTTLVSITVLASFFNYWYYRFGLLLYLPVFAFAANLYEVLPYKKKIWIRISFVITLLLTIKDLSQYYFLYGGI